MRPFVVLHAFFIWALLHGATSDNDERISSLEEQVLTLNSKMEKLEREIVTRNEVIRVLALSLAEIAGDASDASVDACVELSRQDGESTGSTDIEEEEEDKPDTVSPVTFMEARRELQGSNVKFSVRYKPDVEEYAITWQDHVSRRFPRLVNHLDVPLSDGLRETSILVAPPPESMEEPEEYPSGIPYPVAPVSVSFRHPNGDGVFLMLRNEEKPAVERNIPFPVLKVMPGGDLVYDDDEDVIFTVSTPIVAEHPFYGPVGRVAVLEMFFRSPETEELLHDPPGDETGMELLGRPIFEDHQDWQYRINTSDFRTSGIFVSTTGFNSQVETSLIVGSQCKKVIVLRPSTQEGAFPPGYMEFIRDNWRIYDEDGSLQSVCRADKKECGFTCSVLGTEVTRLTAYKVQENGSMIPVDDTIPDLNLIQGPTDDAFTRQVSVSYPSTFREGSQRFRCVAEDGEGRTVQQDVVVLFSVLTSIVEEESKIQILYMNDTFVELRIVCKVKGRPHSNVTFFLNTYGAFDPEVEPDDVIVGSEDTIFALKYFTYDPSNYETKLSEASCSASVDFPYYDYDVYRIPMPDHITG